MEEYIGTYFQNMGLNAIDAAATVRGQELLAGF
jgi:hypothetical protein